MTDLTEAIAQCLTWDYGIKLSHIFEIPNIQMKT